ncbi:MAG: HDOD domain-containing protein, partial [Thermogutta sp.]|nr:HDOD domain-containing protein [Thermogutta sp.]
MKRIFFVDDEQKVVDGLRRMLRAMRDEWEMSFFSSGPAALEAMAVCRPDIVVSDMRMPGMNGAEFLGEVRRRHPGTVRLILSGQCDRDAVLDAAGPAHQFLSKPCSAETLRSTIGRICEIQDQLANTEIRAAVARLQALPIHASHLRTLAEVLAPPKTSETDLIRVVNQDLALFSKCLQLVSSGFLGTQPGVINPAEVVPAMGTDAIRSLVLEKRIFPALPAGSALESWANLFQKVSQATAETARRIAAEERAGPATVRLAEIGGHLARIGVAVLAVIDPAKYLQIWRLGVHRRMPKMDLEMRFYGVHRADVGAYLLGLWGAPSELVDIVRNTPWPRRAGDRDFSALTAAHAACFFVEEAASELLQPNYSLDLPYLQEVGAISRLDCWREIARSVVDDVEIT